MNWSDELVSLFGDSLLDDVKPLPPKITSEDRLVESFLEINEWIRNAGKLPQESADDFKERLLFRRLKSIQSNEEKREWLKSYDENNLLTL